MINLEINVTLKPSKNLEFSQSLTSQKAELQNFFPEFDISSENNNYRITSEFQSEEQLKKVLENKAIRILAGAIRTLGETSEIIIRGIGKRKWASDFGGIPINYLK